MTANVISCIFLQKRIFISKILTSNSHKSDIDFKLFVKIEIELKFIAQKFSWSTMKACKARLLLKSIDMNTKEVPFGKRNSPKVNHSIHCGITNFFTQMKKFS